MRIALLACALALSAACAHKPLAGSDLDTVGRPAFISRIEENAGPRSEVFRSDSSYSPKLKRLTAKEADRRMSLRLQKAMTRFEIAERLRATTASKLPQERPWTNSVDPARVAATLQSFLVEEVPANAPDYQLVGELGADSVVEFVVEEYGVTSDDGRAYAYMLGYGRLFTLDGTELWRRSFRVDQRAAGAEGFDPFAVVKDPEVWRNNFSTMIDAVAAQFAQDLNPPGRRGGPALPAGQQELAEDGDVEAPNKASTDAEALPPVTEDDPI